MEKIILLSIILFNISCTILQNSGKAQPVTKQDTAIVYAEIDSVANLEVQQQERTLESIFEWYQLQEDEAEDPYVNWSQKMFGRCCSEADLDLSEIMFFNIDSDIPNPKYPIKNMSDTGYTTAYVFKEGQQPRIDIKVDKENDYFGLGVKKYFENLDTLAHPLTLSLINGYTKSEATYYNNARVKQMQVLLNGMYQGTVELLDTPFIQQFTIETLFTINDVITLVPLSVYKGKLYDDVCITEIQQNLGLSGHPNLNAKYRLND